MKKKIMIPFEVSALKECSFQKEKCKYLHITKKHRDVKQLTLNCDGTGRNKYKKGMNRVLLGKAQLICAEVMGKTIMEGSGILPDLKP